MILDELNRRFGITGAVEFAVGRGGLTQMAILAQGSRAAIYLYGAHVAHYQPAGQGPVLWTSRKSWFEPGKPIRGGVPVCFPWFGPRDSSTGATPVPDARRPSQPGAKDHDPPRTVPPPAHGFVRLMEWDLESVRQEASGVVTAVLAVRSGPATPPYWDGEFSLRHIVSVGPALSMTLETTNTGGGNFVITEALHTYLAVSDARHVSIRGLEDTRYVSKVEGGLRKTQDGSPVTFAGETDRCYLNTTSTCVLEDSGLGRRIIVAKSGSDSTVVWNPWIAKAAGMPDFGDDEWQEMVCLETANVMDNAVAVAPGQTHSMQAKITVARAN